MPKLVKVDNPSGGFRVEGPLLHFDEVVPLETAVDLIVYAYQRILGERGINRKVHAYKTTGTQRFRLYGIAVEGQKWRAPLFEVVSGQQYGQVYTFTRYANEVSLAPDECPLIKIDRVRMFDPYLGRELSDLLSQ